MRTPSESMVSARRCRSSRRARRAPGRRETIAGAHRHAHTCRGHWTKQAARATSVLVLRPDQVRSVWQRFRAQVPKPALVLWRKREGDLLPQAIRYPPAIFRRPILLEIEGGRWYPKPDRIQRMAAALGCSYDDSRIHTPERRTSTAALQRGHGSRRPVSTLRRRGLDPAGRCASIHIGPLEWGPRTRTDYGSLIQVTAPTEVIMIAVLAERRVPELRGRSRHAIVDTCCTTIELPAVRAELVGGQQ